jgi:transposase
MSKALSLDLRERVLAAVAQGASGRQAALRFGVSAASVSRWRDLARRQGNARPGPLGGDRRSAYSTPSRARIPRQGGRSFHAKAGTDSTRRWALRLTG